LKFVKDRCTALDNRQTEGRGLDATGTAIEKSHPKRMFQVRDCFRDIRLRHAKFYRTLRHATCLCNSQQDTKLPQLESPLDLGWQHRSPIFIRIWRYHSIILDFIPDTS